MANETKRSKGTITSIEKTTSTDKYGNPSFKISFEGGFEGLKNYKDTPKYIKVGDTIDFEFQNYSGVGKTGDPYDINRIVKIDQEEAAKEAAKGNFQPKSSGRPFDPTVGYLDVVQKVMQTSLNCAVAACKTETSVAKPEDVLGAYEKFFNRTMEDLTFGLKALKEPVAGQA